MRGRATASNNSPAGARVSYDKYRSGLPLILVQGFFSELGVCEPTHLEGKITFGAIARRGPGETDATEGHALEGQSSDGVAVIRSIGELDFLLGHSPTALTPHLAPPLPRTGLA